MTAGPLHPGPARVLFVCTGNVCRSPLGAALLRTYLARQGVDDTEVHVASAGVRALQGQPMTRQTERELLALGGVSTAFAARQLLPEMVRSADLVVTAERSHRAEVVQLAPRALRYSFTLRELKRLLDDADLDVLPADPASRLRELAHVASMRKGMAPPTPPEDDDIPDPYRGTDADYALTSRHLEPAVRSLAAAIGGRE
ncbi:low molecular weight phosphatase family protein [Angustibacter sp. McL0619]|uniref:arsenate reductase/protein-tyrosine-phosphatase family protein n=1 Tax=Angustibacter sp. McL0619 TaxID=3415676 RepID=UPI003CFB2A3C